MLTIFVTTFELDRTSVNYFSFFKKKYGERKRNNLLILLVLVVVQSNLSSTTVVRSASFFPLIFRNGQNPDESWFLTTRIRVGGRIFH